MISWQKGTNRFMTPQRQENSLDTSSDIDGGKPVKHRKLSIALLLIFTLLIVAVVTRVIWLDAIAGFLVVEDDISGRVARRAARKALRRPRTGPAGGGTRAKTTRTVQRGGNRHAAPADLPGDTGPRRHGDGGGHGPGPATFRMAGRGRVPGPDPSRNGCPGDPRGCRADAPDQDTFRRRPVTRALVHRGPGPRRGADRGRYDPQPHRSEEHTSELQSH